jgi:exo-1,4-beta-D-glucosaminidase
MMNPTNYPKRLVVLFTALACLSIPSWPDSAGNTVELSGGWKLASASRVKQAGETISTPQYTPDAWYPILRMPATVLEILEEDKVYPNLYFGMNLLNEVPQDLYKEDWWYRTTFQLPAGEHTVWLEVPGINYRAEIWINGHLIANNREVVGMYNVHEFNISKVVLPGQLNALAVKVTPERAIQNVNGVELADSWFDWINWKYLGDRGRLDAKQMGTSFVPDRNAGVWKPVSLRITGPVELAHPMVTTHLPLPSTDVADLTVWAVLRNGAHEAVNGVIRGTISRSGKANIVFEKPVVLSPGESKEISFSASGFPQLTVHHPDLWWPYTLGEPNLYGLQLEFKTKEGLSDVSSSRFGIRTVTQHRDDDEQFPNVARGGSFYVQVNGKNFLARGAVYTPDLLYRYEPDREAAILSYVKDMGLNMLRWESKISGEHIIQLADEAGIPVGLGWMCCNQWEKWDQWSSEDQLVARQSLRSQIYMLRGHASAFIWANGSDGLPPEPVRSDYHKILADLHWQNAIVDTVSSYAKDPQGNTTWNGIHMQGPYSWRPPSYWFSGRYAATRGACAEQGDNESIPPFESLKKFIPADKLWPINEYYFFHSGSIGGNSELRNIREAVDRRYGPSSSAEEFSTKAQLAHYENTRAQFEDFGANGWPNHKMSLYWMLDNHWPSFFGHLFDYYLKPGGAYYGAKMGLRPVSLVFDYYATGDHKQAVIRAVNQSPEAQDALRARVRVYDLNGQVRYDREARSIHLESQAVLPVLTLPRPENVSGAFFVRCELFDHVGGRIVDNVYWQSTTDDDFGDPKNDESFFELKQASWADFTSLNKMAKAPLEIKGGLRLSDGDNRVTVTLHNPTHNIAFFERLEVTDGKDGNEILPIRYDNNYVTVFPGETVTITGEWQADASGGQAWLRLAGYNTDKQLASLE